MSFVVDFATHILVGVMAVVLLLLAGIVWVLSVLGGKVHL